MNTFSSLKKNLEAARKVTSTISGENEALVSIKNNLFESTNRFDTSICKVLEKDSTVSRRQNHLRSLLEKWKEEVRERRSVLKEQEDSLDTENKDIVRAENNVI